MLRCDFPWSQAVPALAHIWGRRWAGRENAVEWVVVFCLTIWAHYKRAHGGFGAVIRHIFYYGEAGSAIGAVGEWVMIASVFEAENFPEASLAGGDIRGHRLILSFFGDAVADFKACVFCRRVIGNGDAFYVSQRRRVVLKLGQEALNVFIFTLDFDFDIFGGVAHPAFQIVFAS